jgi:hypothetical protein
VLQEISDPATGRRKFGALLAVMDCCVAVLALWLIATAVAVVADDVNEGLAVLDEASGKARDC